MESEVRLTTKHKSKTAAVTSVLPYETRCRIGPSDEWCHFRRRPARGGREDAGRGLVQLGGRGYGHHPRDETCTQSQDCRAIGSHFLI